MDSPSKSPIWSSNDLVFRLSDTVAELQEALARAGQHGHLSFWGRGLRPDQSLESHGSSTQKGSRKALNAGVRAMSEVHLPPG